MRGGADLEDNLDIAASWGDLFFSGQVRDLDWLTTRTCTVDLSGSASEADPMDREQLRAYSRALHRAFEDVSWRVGRIEQREHEVRLDASLEARHAGPLDLSFRDGPTYPASGRRLRLPLQRFAWTIAHGRVLRFEIEQGPGLGLAFLARELGLNEPMVEAERQPAGANGSSDEQASQTREETASTPDPLLHPARDGEGGKPSIADLIEEIETRMDDPAGTPDPES